MFICKKEASFVPLSLKLNLGLQSLMGLIVFLALCLSFIGHSSATYCICKDGVPTPAMQKTIDYACGQGADCHPILQNGPCFQPNNVKSHCDYAANSYFQNKAQAPGTCDFSQTAVISPSLPTTVISGCSYPTSAGQTVSTGISTTSTSGSTSNIYSPTGMAPSGFGDTNPNGGSSLSLKRTLLLWGLVGLVGLVG